MYMYRNVSFSSGYIFDIRSVLSMYIHGVNAWRPWLLASGMDLSRSVSLILVELLEISNTCIVLNFSGISYINVTCILYV